MTFFSIMLNWRKKMLWSLFRIFRCVSRFYSHLHRVSDRENSLFALLMERIEINVMFLKPYRREVMFNLLLSRQMNRQLLKWHMQLNSHRKKATEKKRICVFQTGNFTEKKLHIFFLSESHNICNWLLLIENRSDLHSFWLSCTVYQTSVVYHRTLFFLSIVQSSNRVVDEI